MAVTQNLENTPCDIEDYKSDRVSDQVVKVIQSYTDYVNRVIWKKSIL